MNKPERATASISVFLSALLAFSAVSCGGPDAEPAPTVRNLRALAKLYGYIRYFHPSDEAARVDWDALAIYAAGKVKDAADPAALKAALEEIFRPVAPTLALRLGGEASPAPVPAAASPSDASKLVSWQHYGMGTGIADSVYHSVRLNRPFAPRGQAVLRGPGLDVSNYRGKTVRLKAWVKVRSEDDSGRAQLWLRVDRPSSYGFFDNMSDRPVRNGDWAICEISGPIAADAMQIAFGAICHGSGEFFLDGFHIDVTDASGLLATIPIPNGGFEEGDAGAAPPSWAIQNSSLDVRVRTDDIREGKRALSLASRSQAVATPLFDKRAPAGTVVDREIGPGLFARFPLTLEADGQGTLPHADAGDFDRLSAALNAAARPPLTGTNESVRLADVIIAWNVFQHFYPYFDVVKADWDAVLTRSLERALSDRTEEDLLRTLSWLVARLDDGHGGVYHASQQKLGRPPFAVEWIEGQAVVLASRDPAFKRGDAVLAIDGREARDILREDEEYLSGSPQWKRYRSTAQFGLGPAGSKSRAKLGRGRETLEVPFERAAQAPVSVPPARSPIDTLEDGILYVDLSRAPWPDISARIKDLAAAKGVVFDLRGYPNGNHQVLSHLLREPDLDSAWMKVPLIVLPDREGWTFDEMGWNLPTASPRIEGRVAFLTDGRAISYAESFMSFVEHYKLGEIVGEPTAGANGNVNPFALPGGYNVAWTGMKVVKHDGSQHHTIGILPTVPCRRTIAGVAAGRDELLEKALEVVKRDLP